MNHLPSLTENRPLRFLTISVLYFTQGIQTGLFLTAMPAYLANQGAKASAIAGFIGVIMLPWTFKIIGAVLMDRFTFLPMGRRRPWVIAAMIGAVIGYIAMAWVEDPINHISLLVITGLIVSTSTAFMDVAVDSMTVDIVPEEEYSKANAFMMGSNAVGLAVTIAVGSWALSRFGISFTFMGTAVFVALISLFPILLKERNGERIFPWSEGEVSTIALELNMESWGEILRNLLKALVLPASILLGLVSFLIGSTNGLLKAFLPVLTVQELGWLDTDFSNLVATASLVAGITGMTIGGFLISWLGTIRGAIVFLGTLILVGLFMGFFPTFWKSTLAVEGFIFAVNILRTLFLIALFTACMAICWKQVAATQFTIYMAISNFGISLGAGMYGWLASFQSSELVFFAFALIIALMIGLLMKVNLHDHSEKVRELERI
ncbi:MAG: MFS transporter [Bacteroidia bacterium]